MSLSSCTLTSLRAGTMSYSSLFVQNLSCCLVQNRYSTNICWLVVNIHFRISSWLFQCRQWSSMTILQWVRWRPVVFGWECWTRLQWAWGRNQSFLSCKYETLSFDIRLRITGFELLPEANRKPLDVRPSTTVPGSLMPRYAFLGIALELQWKLSESNTCKTATIWPGENITPPFHSFSTYEIISPGFMWCHGKKKKVLNSWSGNRLCPR